MSGVRELIQNLPSNLNVFRNTSFTYLFKWGIGKFFLKKKETGDGKNISDFGRKKPPHSGFKTVCEKKDWALWDPFSAAPFSTKVMEQIKSFSEGYFRILESSLDPFKVVPKKMMLAFPDFHNFPDLLIQKISPTWCFWSVKLTSFYFCQKVWLHWCGRNSGGARWGETKAGRKPTSTEEFDQ